MKAHMFFSARSAGLAGSCRRSRRLARRLCRHWDQGSQIFDYPDGLSPPPALMFFFASSASALSISSASAARSAALGKYRCASVFTPYSDTYRLFKYRAGAVFGVCPTSIVARTQDAGRKPRLVRQEAARAPGRKRQRIERSEVLSLGLGVCMMQTPSGQQEHYVLDSTLVPFWLATMDASRLRGDCRRSPSSCSWARSAGSTW